MPKPKLTESYYYQKYVKGNVEIGMSERELKIKNCIKRRKVKSCKDCLHYGENCYEDK